MHKKDVQKYLDKINQFDSFDGYFNDLNHLKLINFNNFNWNLSKCNCSWFLKNYMCCHIICLSAILKPSEVIFPENAKNVPIGKNHRRGRPPYRIVRNK